jgi:RNA ligase (TIGR02306 family)
MRKLASIQTIREIRTIKGADQIELVIINNWQAVVAKAEGHQVGDLVVYCEIDSFLPEVPQFEFLRKGCYKQLPDGTGGFRLRTIKLRGELSQGLVISMTKALEVAQSRGHVFEPVSSQDVSVELGITKWDPPIPAHLAGMAKGPFPSFIQKTDEERVQGLTEEWNKLRRLEYYVTEKLDGSSATFYFNDGEFGACSRNLDLKDTESNTHWQVAKSLDLPQRMQSLGRNIAIQGELIGPGVQGNPYRLNSHEVRIFNVFDINLGRKIPINEMLRIIEQLNETGPKIVTVPILVMQYMLPAEIEELLEQAEGDSTLRGGVEREGIVLRTHDCSISFKAISNRFLLGGGE